MLNFLKSDNTWFPEQENDFFVIRANKDFVVNAKDFEEYPIGIRFDFPQEYKVIIEIHESYKNKLSIFNNIVIKSNYKSPTQTTVSITNISGEEVCIKNTDKLLKCYLINSESKKNNDVNFEVQSTFSKITNPDTNAVAPMTGEEELPNYIKNSTKNFKMSECQHVHESAQPVLEVVQLVPEVAQPVAEVIQPVAESPQSVVEITQPIPESSTSAEEEKPKRRYVKKKTV